MTTQTRSEVTEEAVAERFAGQSIEELSFMIKEAKKLDECMAAMTGVIGMGIEAYGPHAVCGALVLLVGGIASTSPEQDTKIQLIKLFTAAVRDGTETLLENRAAVRAMAKMAEAEIGRRTNQPPAVG